MCVSPFHLMGIIVPKTKKRKYFDPKFQATTVRIQMGEHFVADDPKEMLVTVLGSCISACIRDRNAGIGGMNHFMLPESECGTWGETTASLRYGNHAMEVLLNDLLKRGCHKRNLEIKIFGGANVYGGNIDIGQQNCEFIKRYLDAEKLPCDAYDLGGDRPRRIHFQPETGKVKRLLLRKTKNADFQRNEMRYRGQIFRDSLDGDVELFD